MAKEYLPKNKETDPGKALLAWQSRFGRKALPWFGGDAYARWVSEIMLQQTQVTAVIPYYERFMKAFPTVGDLAAAPEEEVMRHWAGLGYYARARNLHACAKRVVSECGGSFPQTRQELQTLPGIGRSTAAAIASAAFGADEAILDGNVKRVFSRVMAMKEPVTGARAQVVLLAQAEKWLPRGHAAQYNQALMDLGALVCVRGRPRCDLCPVCAWCGGFAEGSPEKYPVKPVKKPVPERDAVMLVWVRDGAVWLEKRKGKGVWQGLLSLPERESPPEGGVLLARFTHRFTHYLLNATLYGVKGGVPEGEGRWVARDALAEEALPSPVKKVLISLEKSAFERQ